MSDKKIKVYEKDITEFKPDQANVNKGSERGQRILDTSIAETGLHRGIFVDKNDIIPGGNKTHQAAIDAGFRKAVVVETTGDTLVVTKRIDMDLLDASPNSPGRKAAYLDNRSNDFVEYDAAQVMADIEAGTDLSAAFFDEELAEMEEDALLAVELSEALLGGAEGSSNRNLGDKKYQIKPVLYMNEVSTFEEAIMATGQVNRGQALLEICRYYLEQAKGQFDF